MSSIKKTILTAQDEAEICRRRFEKGAAATLSKQYGIGAARVRNIWKAHFGGTTLEAAHAHVAAGGAAAPTPQAPPANARRAGKFVAEEPPPMTKVAGAVRAKPVRRVHKKEAVAAPLPERLEANLGMIGAGNNSRDLAAEVAAQIMHLAGRNPALAAQAAQEAAEAEEEVLEGDDDYYRGRSPQRRGLSSSEYEDASEYEESYSEYDDASSDRSLSRPPARKAAPNIARGPSHDVQRRQAPAARPGALRRHSQQYEEAVWDSEGRKAAPLGREASPFGDSEYWEPFPGEEEGRGRGPHGGGGGGGQVRARAPAAAGAARGGAAGPRAPPGGGGPVRTVNYPIPRGGVPVRGRPAAEVPRGLQGVPEAEEADRGPGPGGDHQPGRPHRPLVRQQSARGAGAPDLAPQPAPGSDRDGGAAPRGGQAGQEGRAQEEGRGGQNGAPAPPGEPFAWLAAKKKR